MTPEIKPIIEIKNQDIKLEFFFGRIFLLYKNVYLTKKFGFYTSIYSKKWYDSRLAIWNVLEKGDNFFKVYGDWSYIPIRQVWELNIEDNRIHWQITMEAMEKFEVELAQQNIMLSEFYDLWDVPSYAQGKFPSFFANYKGVLWDRIWSMPQIRGEAIRVYSSKANIPGLKWISPFSSQYHLLVIENSDPQYCSRILQSLFVNSEKKPIFWQDPIIFEAQIEIEETF